MKPYTERLKGIINNERESRLLILSTYLFEQYPRHAGICMGIKMKVEKDAVLYHFERLFKRYPVLEPIKEEIQKAYEVMTECYEKNGKLLVCGNGGSASDSDHIVGELMKGFYKERPLELKEKEKIGAKSDFLQGALPAISLTQHTALSSAFLNDVAPDMIFAQQVYGYGRKEDIFLGLSTSGNSINVVNAANIAKSKGLKVISLTGRDGGLLKEISDVCIIVPAEITADIQELHLPVYHTICAMLEETFF